MNNTTARYYILPLLITLCTLFYYFGELIDWAAWDAVRANFFYGIHDVHRLLFLAPIIYAGYNARIKGAIIITLVSFIIFVPRAFFISPYPDPLLRMAIFTVFAGIIGILVGAIRNQTKKYQQLQVIRTKERDKMLKIMDGITDGIVITDTEFRIRFMNSNMVNNYGEGTGMTCYEHLQKTDAPCKQICKIPDVINSGQIQHWQCKFPDGNTYEIRAAPYIDSDGTACQISVFREVSHDT